MEKEKGIRNERLVIRNERLVQRGAKLFGAMLDRSPKRRDGEYLEKEKETEDWSRREPNCLGLC